MICNVMMRRVLSRSAARMQKCRVAARQEPDRIAVSGMDAEMPEWNPVRMAGLT